jgi:FkbM family methyltransferase
MAWGSARNLFIWLRILGARCIRIDENGNGVLVLNRKSPLGMKGDWVHTPQDKTIFKYVIEHGEWEIDESRFLADQISRVQKTQEGTPKVTFIDIGANSGLVTRQVLNLSKSDCDVVLVEPIPNHIKAIQANLKEFNQKNNLIIVEAALGETTGELEISIENSNRGNSSFLPSAMPTSGFVKLNVKTIAVQDFATQYIPNSENFVLKSDVQGYDSKILALLPEELWNRCIGAVIEVWSLPEIEQIEVKNLLGMWKNFTNLNWAADYSRPATLEEIEKFWLSKSGKSRNLFLSNS